MSLQTVIDGYSLRRYGSSAGSAGFEHTAGRQTGPVQDAASQLVKWIPTEMLAFYVPTCIPFSDATLLWILYFLGVLLTPAFVFVQVREEFKARKKPKVFYVPFFPMVAGTIAFGVWAAALPGSILIRSNLVTGTLMTGIIIGTTVILSLVERGLKL